MIIGYYAHHHGSGHCNKAKRVAGWMRQHDLQAKLTVLTSAKDAKHRFKDATNIRLVMLADENPTPEQLAHLNGDSTKPDFLHYNPVGNRDIVCRSQQILTSILEHNIDIVIIDLSVEVATLCRVSSVAYCYVRLPGERTDNPHLQAFKGAQALLAFFPPELENANTPTWVKQKTIYIGFQLHKDAALLPAKTSNTQKMDDTQQANDTSPVSSPGHRLLELSNAFVITVISGYGGHDHLLDAYHSIRVHLNQTLSIKQQQQVCWIWLGATFDQQMDAAIQPDWQGQVDDVATFMANSAWVITAAGMTTVAEMQQHPTTPWTVVAEPRHFAEQADTAQQLVAAGAALSVEQTLSKLPQYITGHQSIANHKLANNTPAAKPAAKVSFVPRHVISSNNCVSARDVFATLIAAKNLQHWLTHDLPNHLP